MFGQRFHVDPVAACVGNDLQQLGLLGRALRQGFDVAAAALVGNRNGLLHRVQRLAPPQQRWQCGGSHLADRVVVVVGREANQPECFGGQQGRVVQRRLGTLQPRALERAVAGRVHDEPDLAAAAERHQHPGARQRRRTAVGWQVVEQPGERTVDSDVEYGLLRQKLI